MLKVEEANLGILLVILLSLYGVSHYCHVMMGSNTHSVVKITG